MKKYFIEIVIFCSFFSFALCGNDKETEDDASSGAVGGFHPEEILPANLTNASEQFKEIKQEEQKYNINELITVSNGDQLVFEWRDQKALEKKDRRDQDIKLSESSTLSSELTFKDYNQYIHKNKNRMTELIEHHKKWYIRGKLNDLVCQLSKITYGSQLKSCANWLKQSVDDWRDLHNQKGVSTEMEEMVVIRSLLNAPLYKDSNKQAIVCPFINEIDEHLSDAIIANQGEGLETFLVHRFSVSKKQRESKRLKASQINALKNRFGVGNISLYLMPRSRLPNYGGILINNELVNNKFWVNQLKKDKMFWADEVNSGDEISLEGKELYPLRKVYVHEQVPKSFTELFKKLKNDKNFSDLELNTNNQKPVQLAEYPTFAKNIFMQPVNAQYLYAEYGQSSMAPIGIHDEWVPVTGMIFVEPDVILTLPNAEPTPHSSHVRFHSYNLKPAYYSNLRGSINSITSRPTGYVIPKGKKPFAIGVGTTRKNEEGKVYTAIKFRSKKREFTINKI